MRILQINKFYYLCGGTERYLFSVSNALEKQGHTVIAFSMQDKRNRASVYSPYFAEQVNVRRFSFKDSLKTFYNYDAVRRLERLLKKTKPEVAHLHNISHHLSPAIIPVLKKFGLKVVQTLHDYKLVCPNRELFHNGQICQACLGGRFYHCFFNKCIFNSYPASLLGALEAYWHKRTYAQVDKFIAPSQFMRQISIQAGQRAERVKVIYNFIPDDFWQMIKEKRLDKMQASDYLLYFGRLSYAKGLDTLLEALVLAGNHQRLKIVGDGEREKVEKKIKDLDLSSRVELHQPLAGEKLWRVVARAKAIVIPSLWPENMPYSLLEAMALAKPVIVSAVGGLPEVIKDKVSGFVFAPGDSQQLSQIIKDLDKFDLQNIGRLAQEKVLTKHNEKEHIKQLLELYKDISISS